MIDFTKVKAFIAPAEDFVVKNSPTILTGFGIAGMFTSIIFTAKATPKYLEIKAKREAEFTENTTKSEKTVAKAKSLGQAYWPTALSFTLSSVSIIFANRINLRRNAALLAAYTLSETALKDYKDELKERLNPKKVEEIERGITKKHVDSNPPVEEEVCFQGHIGDMLMYDPNSGQYFYSTPDKIKEAKNYINDRLNCGYEVCRNEFYEELNDLTKLRPKLKTCVDGERRGWSREYMDGLLDIGLRAPLDVNDHDRPCWELVYEDYDLPDYEY